MTWINDWDHSFRKILNGAIFSLAWKSEQETHKPSLQKLLKNIILKTQLVEFPWLKKMIGDPSLKDAIFSQTCKSKQEKYEFSLETLSKKVSLKSQLKGSSWAD